MPLWFRRSEPHLPRAASLLETTTQGPPKQLTMAGNHPFRRLKYPAPGTPVEREAKCRLNQPLPSKIIQGNIEIRPASRLHPYGFIRSIINVVFAQGSVRYRLVRAQHAPSSRVPARTSGVKLPCLWPRHDCMDRPLALILLILAAPLMMSIAFAIIIERPGPVIFRQIRRGLGGKEFLALKFRTMHWEKNPSTGVQTSRLDVRISNVGRVLRRASLDELPQLINVLRGEMSLVGPRPHADGLYDIETERFMLSPEYAERYRVKPGITGWAQIHGLRGAIHSVEEMKQRVLYDTHYIKNKSLSLYAVILIRTPFAIALGRNAF